MIARAIVAFAILAGCSSSAGPPDAGRGGGHAGGAGVTAAAGGAGGTATDAGLDVIELDVISIGCPPADAGCVVDPCAKGCASPSIAWMCDAMPDAGCTPFLPGSWCCPPP